MTECRRWTLILFMMSGLAFPFQAQTAEWEQALKADLNAMADSLTANLQPWNVPNSVFRVEDHGATADGVTVNTIAIQKAIDACSAAGGGIVRFQSGIYCTGSIELKSGVTLQLEKDAVLLGSADLADYRRGQWPALLLARNQRRIAVTGEGAIDGNSVLLEKVFEEIRRSGNGLGFFPNSEPGRPLNVIGPTGVPTTIDPHALQAGGKLIQYLYGNMTRPYEFVRPQIIEFRECRDVTVRGITLRNAACWVQTYRNCEDVWIDSIKVRSTHYWNNDGIDLVDCRRVKILDCDIDSADDALCLKSDPPGRGCENITIARCLLASRASALKFGSASHHGFRRVHAFDLTVRNTYRSVVAIQSVDGAVIENVTVERVKATNTGNAFFIRLGHRTQNRPPGRIRGVVIRDFDVEVRPENPGEHMDVSTPHNPIPSSIVGLPGHPVRDILLDNIRVKLPGGGKREKAEIALEMLDTVPENARNYPEFSMWGELPAWGAYIRHTRNITMNRVTFTLDTTDFRPAVVADDAAGLRLDECTVGSGGGEPIVVLKNSPGAQIVSPNFPPVTLESVRELP